MTVIRQPAPARTEAAPYYFRYIEQVEAGDIVQILADQGRDARGFLQGVTEEQSLFRYAPGKWTVREVAAHLNDTERLFVFRAFWFGRGFEDPLPSFEQEIANRAAAANERTWAGHVEEFEAVRAATNTFFRNLPPEAWSRQGIASGTPFSVRALAYMCAGHVTHHLKILRERYLPPAR